jgi:uncharacterized protein
MAFRIDETFAIHAPADRVFQFLVDPRQVVQCLPGAELTDAPDDRTFLGRVKVKVGPVTAAYNGQARLVDVDPVARRVQMVGEGRESTGTGSAKMTMTSGVRPLSDGSTEVRVEADVEVAGKIVSFGRGMIETVNKELFRQFVVCVRARLENPQPPADVTPAAGAASAPPSAATSAGAGGAAAARAVGEATPAAWSPIGGSVGGAARSAPAVAQGTATQAAQPVRLVPLILRAIWTSVARAFGRGE